MNTRLLTPAFASVLAAALGACGDNGGDSTATDTSASSTSTAPVDMTTTAGEPTTTAPVDPTTTTETPTTTSDETSTTTPDPSTTGMPGDCQAPADQADEDGDGVANSDDNCRCDANSNQLDFDGDKVGNVCDDPVAVTMIEGTPPEFNSLRTTARASQMGAACEFPVNLVIVGGRGEIELDDVGAGKLYFPSLAFADTPEQVCDIKLGPITVVSLKLYIKEFAATGVDPFVVGFPFTIEDHALGNLNGQTDMPHALNISATIVITESSNPDLAMPGENKLEMLPGQFSAGALAVTDSGGNLALTFADPDFIVFDQMTMTGIQVTMTGLEGTLQMRQ